MRTRLTTLLTIATVFCAAAGTASAQQADTQATAGRITGSVDFGVRFTDLSGDAAKWQRYRDLGDGFYVDALKLNRAGSNWLFQASAPSRRAAARARNVSKCSRMTCRSTSAVGSRGW